jgi:hypothetical protein
MPSQLMPVTMLCSPSCESTPNPRISAFCSAMIASSNASRVAASFFAYALPITPLVVHCWSSAATFSPVVGAAGRSVVKLGLAVSVPKKIGIWKYAGALPAVVVHDTAPSMTYCLKSWFSICHRTDSS